MAVLRPDLMMKCVVPVVMAGIIAVRVVLVLATPHSKPQLFRSQIYGLVVSVLISGDCGSLP